MNNHRRARKKLGDDTLATGDHNVTSEEVSEGQMPEWLRDYIKEQTLGFQNPDFNLFGRILVIYPSEKSRIQTLSSIELSGAIDRTLHHTIESLISSLVADLRLPRAIPNDGPLMEIIHSECKAEASKLGFPLINPLPEMEWGKGKTEALALLHRQLSRDLVANRWDGPGIPTFRKVIRRLEKKLRFTHPDMAIERIIEELETGDTPFTISDVDGIIMLDHSPTMSPSHVEILLSLSKHRPIHQLTYPGNYRLGHHGLLLLDQYPIKEPQNLPRWVPSKRNTEKNELVEVKRVLLRREKHSIEAAVRLTLDRLNQGDAEIIIVDPALEKNRLKWEQMLGGIGVGLERKRQTTLSHPICHWLLSLANLAHGPNSFSLANLRALSLQTSIIPFENPLIHPSDSSIIPSPDPDILTKLARNAHVLGGPGAISKWIEALSRPPLDETDGIKTESTQWWILCLMHSLWPILRGPDREFIQALQKPKGCQTGVILPLQDFASNGDEWLESTISLIDLDSEMQHYSGSGLSPVAAIQTLMGDRKRLRQMQRISGHSIPIAGSEWVEEFTTLVRRSVAPSGGPNYSGNVSLLSPEETLGCTSDMIILANVSSSSWDLRVPKIPYVGDEERHTLGILRPDGPIRDARHQLQHILNASPEVIILDSSNDETSPPSAPIREWIRKENEKGNIGSLFDYTRLNYSPRASRQDDGLQIREGKAPRYPPINPSAISIPIDSQIQRDRERRQPTIPEEDGYLPNDTDRQLLSIENLRFHGKTPEGIKPPRINKRWPVIGAILDGRKTTSIDPRPLSPTPTGNLVSDSRHGHSAKSKQKISVWSPTRLQAWLKCPRMGWQSKELRTDREELQGDDLDNRTYGDLLHNVHHDIIAYTLDFKISTERNIKDDLGHINLSRSGLDSAEIMKIALEALDSRAPWLERTDAVSTQRLRSLTGMNKGEWSSWLADPRPIPPAGRIGQIVLAELELSDSVPVSIEWMIRNQDSGSVEISLPPELSGGIEYDPIKVKGWIDRVDLLPHNLKTDKWEDKDGDNTVAPIRILGSGWRPKRIVAIRDLKTSETTTPRNRHYDGLLEELQLAIYARAWELTHPGDLVLGAGISVIGHNSQHFIEVSSEYSKCNAEKKIGTVTNITSESHRFPDENGKIQSDNFRAWLAQRLSVALKVSSNAAHGRVHPTPSARTCGYCPVRETCNVRMEGPL